MQLKLAALKEAASMILSIIMDPSSVPPFMLEFDSAYGVFYDLFILGQSMMSRADRHALILGIATGCIASSASKWSAHLRTTENLSLAKDLLYMPRYKLLMDVLLHPARRIDSLADEIWAFFEEAWEHLPDSPVVSRLRQRFEDAKMG